MNPCIEGRTDSCAKTWQRRSAGYRPWESMRWRPDDPAPWPNPADMVGVILRVNPAFKTIQFFSIVSFKKGNGRKMVAAVVEATPEDWSLAVVMDWSDGFWEKMREEYPRIMIF